VFVDHSSVELFIDDGLVSLTVQVFPDEPFSDFDLKAGEEISNFRIAPIESIWN
jgi:sucrose-6-phosphate hydrolase SacC (GH32 family)